MVLYLAGSVSPGPGRMRVETVGCEWVKVRHTMLPCSAGPWTKQSTCRFPFVTADRAQASSVPASDGRMPTQMGDGSMYSMQWCPFPHQLNGTPVYNKAGKMVQRDFLDVVILLTCCQKRCSTAALLRLAVPVLPYCSSTNLPSGWYLHSCIQLPKQHSGEILSLKTHPGG